MLHTLASATLVALLCAFQQATAFPLTKRADLTPVITTDFPDPSIIKVGDTWYAFGTQSEYDYKDIRVQLATSKDFSNWTLTGKDVLGSLAPWARASGPAVWAPSVSQRDDGSFLMYYSAVTTTAGDGKFHCVGTATSDTVEGPYYSNSDEPFACPTDQGGALDASYFRDTDGTHYIVYKIDANSLGHGGSCGNTVDPIVKTPIMIQQTQADGITKIGDPIELISNSDRDGPLVEAPYMIKNDDGIYVLFFSSNCYTTDLYDVSYATSTSPTSNFEKTTTPLFVTGDEGLIGPGGASIASDNVHIAFHGYASQDDVGARRAMFVTEISSKGRVVSA